MGIYKGRWGQLISQLSWAKLANKARGQSWKVAKVGKEGKDTCSIALRKAGIPSIFWLAGLLSFSEFPAIARHFNSSSSSYSLVFLFSSPIPTTASWIFSR